MLESMSPIFFLLTVTVLFHESQSFFMIHFRNRFLDADEDSTPFSEPCQVEVKKHFKLEYSPIIIGKKFDLSREYVYEALHRGELVNGKQQHDPNEPFFEMFSLGHLIYWLSREDTTYSCYFLGLIDPQSNNIKKDLFNKRYVFPEDDIWNVYKFLARKDNSINLPSNIERVILALTEKYDITKYATNPNNTYVFSWLYEKGAITKTEMENLKKQGPFKSEIESEEPERQSRLSDEEIMEIVRNFTEGNVSNKTALEYAVEGGHIEVVKYLVSTGADVNPKGTLLHTALLQGRNDILKYLLEQDIFNVDSRNSEGETPLYLAAKTGNYEAARSLMRSGAYADSVDENGDTLLHLAAKNGDISAIEGLIAIGADVDVSNEGMTPLYRAAQYGQTEAMNTLLSHSADINFGPHPGNKLIHVAARNNHSLAVQSLLDMGVDVNLKGMYMFAPIHWAARVGFCNIVFQLLKNGADIQARIDIGRTPLHEAAFWGQIECCSILLAFGADANAIDGAGNKASQLAKQNGHMFLYTMLKDYENKRNTV